MKRSVGAILLLFCFSGVSCVRAQSVNGVWAYWELYKNWNAGVVDELVQPSDVIVDGVTYIGLPNSILISNKEFTVPGGSWKIERADKVNSNKINLVLVSKKNSAFRGVVSVNILSADSVFFTSEKMDTDFEKESTRHFCCLERRTTI